MDVMLNFRVPPGLKDRLEKLAEATGRSETTIAVEALQSYMDEQAIQVAEIREAIVEADAGDFATHEELEAVVRKYR